MADPAALVLKFGGSVLRDDDAVARAVHEVYRHVRAGFAVVAVVSARHGETDALAARARAFDSEPDPHALACLLATGERASAAWLALAVRRAGLACEVAGVERIGLRVRGEPLDAEPVGLDVAALRALLRRSQVVVVPGFVGVDDDGRTALLGRGGSDLTALFVAERLGAGCRLVKDVDGLYERDPALPGSPARSFAAVHYDDALALDGRIVQHKAVRFAQRCGLSFEVGAEGSARATVVGGVRTVLRAADAAPLRPLRVALLGAGTVGLGVYRALARSPATFEVTAVTTRSPRAAVDAGVDPRLLVADAVAAAAGGADVVVEALGGLAPAAAAIAAALRAGAHVVTANKSLLAHHGPALHELAGRHGVELRASAAVGGAAPVLATIARARAGGPIGAFAAVLNATSGFVFDRLRAGRSLAEALHDAAARGLAERDAARDLDGTDAAEKLVLCARAAGFAVDAAAVATAVATDVMGAASALAAAGAGGRVRVVASWSLDPGERGAGLVLRVAPESLHDDHALAFLAADECGAVAVRTDGATFRCRGRGAGRWPTAAAVVADLWDLVRARHGASGPEAARRVAEAVA
ncbi:MAG: homoserine dehydrogenase [Planctomycetota bacterium]